MLRIKRKIGDFRDLNFTLDLTSYYNKTLADIEDIYFVIKGNNKDIDTALFLKKMTAGDVVVNSGTTILDVDVKWGTTEYSQFNFKKEYVAGLYPKFISDGVADENTDDGFIITFVDDTLKQN